MHGQTHNTPKTPKNNYTRHMTPLSSSPEGSGKLGVTDKNKFKTYVIHYRIII